MGIELCGWISLTAKWGGIVVGLLIGIALLVMTITAVVVARAIRFASKQVQVRPVTGATVARAELSERLARALQFETVSFQHNGQVKSQDFIALHKYLEESFPRVHSTLAKETIGHYSLLYTWNGQESGLRPILLMAHTDVVPVETGTEREWSFPPFGGRIADGYIWGRGAMDTKVSVLGILEAVEVLLAEGFQPRRTVYLAFGHDEEVGGINGAAKIAALLQSRGVKVAFILDEGGMITEGVLAGVSAPVALIGIAEKGYVSLELTAQDQGGHSSMPPKHTCVGMLSTCVHRLERKQLPARMETATRKLLDYLGPELSFTKRMVLANLWVFGPLVKLRLGGSTTTNPLIRTTSAATVFEGGTKENVLPAKARAIVNFRILQGESISSVMDHVCKTVNNPRVTIRSLEFISEPSVVSDVNSPTFKILQQTICEVFPGLVVAPSLFPGITDSRHYAKLSDNIYRFVPICVGKEDVRRIHGTDERISVENYEQVVKFYIRLIRNYSLELH